MRIFSFRRIRRLFSFASMGIERRAGRGIRRRHNAFQQRRDAFSSWRLNSEQLEPKKLLSVNEVIPPADGTYIENDVISIRVNFTDPVVNVDDDGDPATQPSIKLTVGSEEKSAVFSGGSGTDSLFFNYTVGATDEDLDGIEILTPIQLNGNLIQNASTGVALTGSDLTLVGLPSTPNVLVSTPTEPTVTVTNGGGVTGVQGDIIEFTATYPRAVTVDTNGGTNTPFIFINVGDESKKAEYVAGSGSTELRFQYEIEADVEDTDGITIPAPAVIDLDGGATMTDATGDVLRTFTAPDTSDVDVDGVAPTVVSVNASPDGSYSNAGGDTIDITVVMDDAVTVDTTGGTPTIPLTIGGQSVNAEFDAVASNSTTLVFSYTIAADVFANGTIVVNDDIILAGGTIQDAAGNEADLDNFVTEKPTPTGVLINRTGPTVTVTEGDGETSAEGDIIEFTATFPHSVTVDLTGGTPFIAINVGGDSKTADYSAGSGSTELRFQYTVLANDEDTNGIAITGGEINLFGGTINDTTAATDPALLTFSDPGTSSVLVDGVAPTVLSATGPIAGNYSNAGGDTIDITVVMDDAVTVDTTGGTPIIPLTIGGQSVNAEFDAVASNSTTLVFSYTIAADVFANGTFTVGDINLAGGFIEDAAGNEADLDNFVTEKPTPTGVLINRTEPTVAVTTPGVLPATSVEGDIIELTVTYAQPVTVDTNGGTTIPFIAINVGDSTVQANYVSGSVSTDLVFQYVIADGDDDTNGITVPGPIIDLNGGTMTDATGDVVLTFNSGAPDTSTVLVDAVAPTVVGSPTGPIAGSYSNTANSNLDITVVMSEAVTVDETGGTPTIPLTIGGQVRNADYFSGTGTTVLVFRYTINSPTDVFANGTFTVGDINTFGGTIRDAAGNDADLTGYSAPTPTGVLINRTEPTVAVTGGDGATSVAGDIIEFTATFPQAVTVDSTGGTPSIAINVGGSTEQAIYTSGSGSTDLVFQYVTQVNDEDANGITIPGLAIDLNGGSISDATGDVLLTFDDPGTSGVLVDAVAPTVVGSPTGPAPGSYGDTPPNNTVDITVVMSEAVTVDDTGGTPFIPLTIGGQFRNADYVSGTGTTTLVFRYTITSSTDVYTNGTFDVGTITLAGGTIQDTAGNDADLGAYVAPTPTGVLINRTAPTVAVTTPAVPATSVAGDIIEFTATYAQAVAVNTTGGTPSIAIDVGGTTQQADYVSGSGSTDLVFQYEVEADDEDTNGITITAPTISLNGGTMTDVNGDVVLSFSMPSTAGVLVDAVAPTVVGSPTGPIAGSYGNGDDLDITVVMSEAVTVDETGGTPTIPLTIGGQIRNADYVSGSGTTTLVFRYTITSPTDVYANGTFTVGAIDLASGTIQDAEGTSADLTGYVAPTPTGVLINRTEPTVAVTGGDGATSVAGDIIEFTATFPQAVTVDSTGGTPSIAINVGGSTEQAIYTSGSGSTDLVFQYVTQVNDEDANGITIPGLAIDLNGGSISDATGDVLLTFDDPGTSGVLVDAVAPTVVGSPTGPAPGSYGATDPLDITVVMSEAVTVDTTVGTPTIPLTFGGEGRNADYISGSGTTTLVFRYEIETDVYANGTFTVGAIDLAGGTIQDAEGTNADLTGYVAPTPTGVLINRTEPTVAVTNGAGETSVAGDIIELTATYAHAVTVDSNSGTPSIAINVGGTLRQADYVFGSGSTDLVFQYVIQDGEEDTNGISIPGPAISLNSGTMTDIAGDPVLLTFAGPDTSTVLVDAVAPTVVSATGPIAGSYSDTANSNLDITVVMSDAVTVGGGTPFIPLTFGGQIRNADYDALLSTGNTLVFRYTITSSTDVYANDTIGVGDIDLAGGTITIQDTPGNDADLTGYVAPTPTGVLINRTEPTVAVTTPAVPATSAAGDIIEFTATYAQAVAVNTTGGTPSIAIDVGGTTQQADYVSGSGSTDLVFQYVIQDGEEDTNGITITAPTISLNGGTMTDVNGNVVLSFVMPSTAGVLVDAVAPTVVGSPTGPIAGSYSDTANSNLDITVVMSEAVTVDTTAGTPIIELDINGRSRQAEYNAGASTSTTLVFRYTIASSTDVFANGTFTVGAIDLAGGTIQDAEGNDADLTGYVAPTPTGVLINRTEPTVAVTTPAGPGTSVAEGIIEFTATYLHDVFVDSTGGTPQIAINVGGTVRQADYDSGSGSTVLVFRYEIQDGDEDTNGITIPLESISLNGGTINDVAGDPALLTFTAPDTSAVLVDGVAPTVVSTFGPAAGSYGDGDNLDITVVMDDAVTVVTTAGTPIIELDINGRSRQAEYNAGASTSTTLVFRYTIASPTDVFANGTFTVGNISTAGGTIQDAIGNDADLTGYIAPTPANVLINRVEPTVTITDGDSDTSAAGEIIELTATYPQAVTVTGTPQIGINIGGTVRQATFSGGNNTTALRFQYEIVDGEEDTNGITIPGPAIELNAGTMTDPTGDVVLSFIAPDTSAAEVDAVAPTALSIEPSAPGSYGNGDNLDITVVMSEAVTVDTTDGTPRIVLTIGGQVRNAEYDAVASNSTTLVFRYTIASSTDVFANGTFIAADTINLNDGRIRDAVGNDYEPTGLAAPTPTGVLINRTEPTVTVTDGDGDTSVEGEIIEFTVDFPHSVTVTGTPQIGINVGGTLQQADYAAGSGSETLQFRYVVQATDEDTNGITIPLESISLNGGTINDVAGDPALLTFTAPDTSAVLVDGVAPTVVSTFGPAAGSYSNAAGDDLTITIVMDDTVTVNGTPTIPLTIGGQSVDADYVSGTGTTTLVFSYTIEADIFANGTFTVGNISTAGGTIQDATGNDADLTGYVAPTPTGVLINRTEPTVTVTDGDGDTSVEGEIIEFTVDFPHSVTVTGTPQIGINVGGTLQQADYAAGSGSETLQFRYVVQATDEDTNGITIPLESISLNGGTINDVAGDPALLTFTAPDTSAVLVDGVAPTVVSTFGPAAGSYGDGDNLDITVVMDDAVTVVTTAGTPIIELDINGRSRQAEYNAGASTSTTLVFRYTIASPTDVFANGTFTVGNISTAGGTIQDAIGNDADLTGYIAPTPANVLINRVEPTVTITDGDSDTSAAGEIIELTATYPQAVTVTGTPQIGINIGGTVRQATFSGGNNTTALRFQYEIVDGEEDTNGITIPGPAIELNAGTMTDPTGDVVLSFIAPDTSAAEVDAVAPTVISASGPTAGSYGNGDDLGITVVMSEDVTVDTTDGTPIIPLDINGSIRNAEYDAVASNSTTLVFRYTIASSTDVYANGTIGVGNIILAGGTIRDAVTNEADLTGYVAPTPTGVLINRTEPTVTVTDGDNTTNSAGDIIEFTVVFPHSVTVTGTPRIGINVGGTLQQADYAAGSGSETLQFRYVVQATDEDTNGITIPLESISLNGGTINDVAGDPALLTFTAPDTSNIDTVTAVLQGITVSDGTYANGEIISLTATFDSVVTVDTTNGTPRIALTLDQGGVVFADYANTGSGTTALVFEYQVQTDDLDLTGIIINDPILPNGGTILGFGGNDAVLTFTAPATDNVLVDAVGPVAVDVAPPTAGSYVTGQVLSFAVDFDDNVEVAGTPLLPINIGGTLHNAEYVGGAGTGTLTFEHIILPTDQDGDGIVVDPANITGTITDAVGNPADFTTVNIPSTANVLVNTAVITTISASPNDLYVAGDTIRLTVIFSQPVNVNDVGGTSTPGIALTVGSNAAIFADYVPGGSGTTTLVFEYEVQPGDVDTDGILVADRITLNGGEINDLGGAPAVLNFTPPDTTGILVDAEGPAAPTLITPAADNYLTGDTLTFNLVFAEPVQVTGSPRIPLEIGTNSGTPTARFAILSAGAGTDTLTFEYVIQPTDHDIDGLQINSPVDGLITDAFGNGADLTIPSLTDAGIRINPTKILSLGVSANGDYITGQHIDFTATFSEPVTVAGTPTIELTIGNATISAVFQSGNGTDELTFRYVVNVNDTDEDGITLVTNTVDLGDPVVSSIVAVSDGGQAILTFTPPETSGITVNAVPRITAVSTTTADGAYDIDDIIDIQVTTSLPVKVTAAGNAKLELNTGIAGTDFATFIGSANVFTNTLVFQYIVQDGDYTADLDYLAIDSLILAAVSQAGNTLDATLELPGSTNSIAFNHDVAISTVQPVVETITTMTPDGAYTVGDNIIIDATLSVPGPAGQTFVFALNSTGIVVLTTDGLGAAQGVYTVQPGHNTDSLKVLAIDPNNTTDAGNNPLSSKLPGSVTVGTISIDTEAPVIMEFGVSAIVDRAGTPVTVDPLGTSGTFGVNAEFSIFATASEDLREGSSIIVTLNNGETVLLSAPTNASSDTLSGTYLVKPSDSSVQDLTIASFVPAVAKDLAGTDLVDTTVPEHPLNIGDVHDLHIDTMPPNVTAFSATSGFFNENKIITINANLSEPISDTSNFTVTLSNNEDVVMSVLAGQDTATGNYIVQAGDNEDPLTIVTIHSVTDVEDALENPLQTDLPTGFNLGDTSAVVLDTTDPTVVSITSDQLTLNGTQTATLTITLSEQSDDFDETDLTFNNATINNFTDLGGGDVYTVELTPEDDFEGAITATVSNSSFTDLADNSFDTTTENANIDVDTKAPSILITSDDNALSIGETADLTFTLSETSSDFDVTDISVANGMINNFTQNASDPSGLTYLAVFTPANTFEGDVVVSVAADSIQDAFLNPNEESTLTLAVDTVAPTVTAFSATSDSYKEFDPVTINANLSEAMSGPSSFDITLSNSQIVTMNILDGETTAVGTYMVQAGDNENPLTVLAIGAGTATDEATNPLVTTIPGGSNLGDTSTVILDTIAPSAVITASPVAVKIGESSTVTITLSEDSNDFDLSDVNITNGTASDFQTVIPDSVYQFTFTPTAGFEGVATISINAGAFTDVAGNPSAALATATITVDTTAPAAPTIALASGITLPISNIEAQNGFLQISGEAGATIQATLRNTLTNATVIVPVGTGEFALTLAQIIQLGNEGSIEITARQTDAAGNVGPDSAPFVFHLDTVIAAPTLAVRNNVTDPLTLAEITDASGVLNVQGELDADITVTFAGEDGGLNPPLSFTGTGYNQPIVLTQADVDQLGEGPITVTATQTDDAGNPSAAASLNLTFDQTAPEIDSLTLIGSGSNGPGVIIPIVGELSEPAEAGQKFNVILNVLDVDNVTPVVVPVTVQANGTDIYGEYVVEIGHNTDDLTIDAHTNDHPSGPVTDLAGNELLDSSSNSSSNLKTLGGGSAGALSTGIIIDTIPPEITEWLPTADTYYDGDDVPIQVRISEPAMPGTTISVRPNTLGTRDAIELERDDDDPTLFTGTYTVELGESTQGADLIVTVDPYPSTTLTDLAGNALVIPSPATQTGVKIDGSITLAADMEWGPNPGNGHSHVLIELSTGVTGMDIGAFTLEHNGRSISLRDASLVATDSSNYILVLPPRIASMSGDGTFIIAIFSEDILAEDDDNVGIDNPLEGELELPDPGMNTNNQGWSR